MQWHPIFAYLLRCLVQDFYEVRTDLPVGDLPRQADITLLRRTAPAPFTGIWRNLTTWNVLEFKGPTDTAEVRDIDLLVEVGLGIDRRLNEERIRGGTKHLPRAEVSWWLLANHIGERFRADADLLLGQSLQLQEGLRQYGILGHPLFLVSRDVLPIERESVPLHLVTKEPLERELQVARELAQQPGFLELYGTWLSVLHPEVYEEVRRMIQEEKSDFKVDFRPAIELVGINKLIEQIGIDKLMDAMGSQTLMDILNADRLSRLTPEQREELKRRLQ